MISLIKVTTNAIKQTKIYKWLIKFWSVCILAGCSGRLWGYASECYNCSPEFVSPQGHQSFAEWKSQGVELLDLNPGIIEDNYNRWEAWAEVYWRYGYLYPKGLDWEPIVDRAVSKLEIWRQLYSQKDPRHLKLGFLGNRFRP